MSRRLTRNTIASMEKEVGQLVDQKLAQTLDQTFDHKLAPLFTAIENLTKQVSVSLKQDQVEDIVNIRCAELKKENQELKERIVYLEAQSRRNNLRFTGIHEMQYETWQDCEKAVEGVLAPLGIVGVHIERAHRLGLTSQPDTRNTPRPIICKFLSFKDRERVIQACRTKEGASKLPRGVRILEDFPPEIDAKRRQLIPYFVAARKANVKARLSMDKLTISGHTYTVDSVDSIPAEFHPKHTSEVGTNIVAFYSQKSLFSNFYPCNFSQDRVIFTSVEQYTTYQKAKLFGDTELADRIMKSDSASKAKALGKRVQGFNAKLWEQKRKDIMMEGLTLKFDQNQDLKDELVATRNKTLVEANPFDKYWGAGLSIYSQQLEDPNSWPGLNTLGKLLMELRAST